jgi:hypothetical protein
LADFNLNNLSPAVLSLVLGTVLIILGAIGGDIEVKKWITIPAIGKPGRISLIVFGSIFSVFGFALVVYGFTRQMAPKAGQPNSGLPPVAASNTTNQGDTGVPPVGNASVTKVVEPNPSKPPKPTLAISEPRCEDTLSTLKMRAENPEGPYMWWSYNDDLEALEVAAQKLIDREQEPRHPTVAKTLKCIEDLKKYEKGIHGTACAQLPRPDGSGNPIDHDHTFKVHCTDNFENYLANVTTLENDIRYHPNALAADRSNFADWFNLAVVNSNGKRITRENP